jgi:hypothetical protein
MRKRSIGFGMLAALLAGGVQPSVAQDARADDVLAKTRAALGWTMAVKSLSVEAETQRNLGSAQMSADAEVLLEMPDKYVKRDQPRGMSAVAIATGFNGDRAIKPSGVTMSAGGAMVVRMGTGAAAHDGAKPTEEQLEEINAATVRTARAEASRLMLGWLGMAHPALKATYAYAGEAESPDGKAHVIDVTGDDGFAARLFIDQNNHLPLMVTYQGRAARMMTVGGPMRVTQGSAPSGQSQAGGKPLTDEERRKQQEQMEEKLRSEMAQQPLVELSLFFDDWREVDGITFPHVMRRASGGETTEEWTITKVKVNPKIDAKKFGVETK